LPERIVFRTRDETPLELVAGSLARVHAMVVSSGARPTRRWLVAIVVVSVAVRFAFLVGDPHPYPLAGLSATNGDVAHNIVAHGRWFEETASLNPVRMLIEQRHRLVDPAEAPPATEALRFKPTVLEMPGEGLLLAGLWTITGDERYVYVEILQVLVDGLMPLVVFWVSLRLFQRRRAALAAAAMYAVFLPLAWMAKVPNVDQWAADLTLLVTASVLKALHAERPGRWWLAAGVATAAGVFFRPTILLPLLLLGLAAIPSFGRRRALLSALVPLVVALGLLAPWAVRNAVVFHRFIPTRIGTGQALWEGMGEISNPYGAVLDDGVTAAQVKAVRPDLEYGTPAYDAYLQEKAVRLIREHPLFYAKVMARRLVYGTVALRNVEWTGTAETLSAYRARTGGGKRSWVRAEPWDALRVVLVTVWEPLLFLAGVATVVATRKRWWRMHLLLLAVPVGTLLPYVFLHLEPRYLLPASFVWIVLATLGADLVLDRLGSRRRRNPAMALAR
jgi:4-amino-4-deoxy-L-arabinose transferase-like glycosyltransferase